MGERAGERYIFSGKKGAKQGSSDHGSNRLTKRSPRKGRPIGKERASEIGGGGTTWIKTTVQRQDAQGKGRLKGALIG